MPRNRNPNASSASTAPAPTAGNGRYANTPIDALPSPRTTLDHARAAVGIQLDDHFGRWLDETNSSAVFPCPICGMPEQLQLIPQADGSIKAECLGDAGCKKRQITDHLREEWGLSLRRRKPRPAPSDPMPTSLIRPTDSIERSVAFTFAQWFKELRGVNWIHIANQSAWWHYEDHIWTPVKKGDNRLLDDIINHRYQFADLLESQGAKELSDCLRNRTWFNDERRNERSDLWAGLRHAFDGVEPRAPDYLLGTPNCIVDLKNLEVYQHEPRFGIRALTGGEYNPDQAAAYLEPIHERLGRVFTPETQAAYLELIALALTGLAQHYRPLVMIIGPTGSGKGGSVNSMFAALGDRAMGVEAHWLKHKAGEIDATTATMLHRRIIVYWCDEVGEESDVQIGRILDLLGQKRDRRARHPFGQLLVGELIGQLWTTAVDLPKLRSDTGLTRRLAVLPTIASIPERERKPEADSPELRNGILTLAIQKAPMVYREHYTASEGDPSAKRRALEEMDPIPEFLANLGDEYHDQPLREVLAALHDHLGEDDITVEALGRRIKKSDRWLKRKRKIDGNSVACIRLKSDHGTLI